MTDSFGKNDRVVKRRFSINQKLKISKDTEAFSSFTNLFRTSSKSCQTRQQGKESGNRRKKARILVRKDIDGKGSAKMVLVS